LFLRGCRSFVETYQNVISIRHSNIEMHSQLKNPSHLILNSRILMMFCQWVIQT
jgi:hypothetical protein